MVKLIFMPKFEHQCTRRIAHDPVASNLLPMKPIGRIAICQDGRALGWRSELKHEAVSLLNEDGEKTDNEGGSA